MRVTKSRSFTKALSYRVFGTVASFIIIYIVTGKGTLATIVAFWETIVKVVLYYFHERVWNWLPWGRVE